MQQFRGLLIGLAVVALLGGGVYWSNKSKDAEKMVEPKDAAPKEMTIFEQVSGESAIILGAALNETFPKQLDYVLIFPERMQPYFREGARDGQAATFVVFTGGSADACSGKV